MIIVLVLCSIILFCLVIYFYKKSNDNMKLKEKKEQALNSNIDSEKNQNKDLSARYNELSQKYEDVCRENKKLYILLILLVCIIVAAICVPILIKNGSYSVLVSASIPFIILIIYFFVERKNDKNDKDK
ncbi:hypothetical protein NGB78_12910 [Staphylococcus arlettae]|uniref:Uncharacterized protein n=1 Tax=Staphylococcus cohnii subsp. cohnii TaxID=74704 RepID=A0A0M2NS53_STACC|nr:MULTISPECIES: hypothetical protein [Staphylococcus]KKI62536.1 hypothetical protein UF66_2272 [Staphylococcus cohnii subsp. cohnii]MEB6244005.1 hypothetical protein [Staphylococcus gallinarum]MEB6297178.1 hypothetical protein [Staphylococcus gallinarum]MEB6333713.1 hypothetical protein [Staphylococcus pseudoxylosus]MEB7422969.1 hypothetical protein [Staphylococcus arlettae]